MGFFFIIRKQKPKRKKSKANTAWKVHKTKAIEIISEVIIRISPIYDIKHTKIAIRNQKARWGSCSSKGNLNFNYKIVHLPPDLIEYLVVHEYCHLLEMNHSAKYWELVSRTIPDYKLRHQRLKTFNKNSLES